MRRLDPRAVQALAGHDLGVRPRVVRGEPAAAEALADWRRFDGVLRTAATRDVMVVDRGRSGPASSPGTGEEARRIFELGQSIVVKSAERYDARLADLARSFREAFDADVHVQLFATPCRRRSFGWHYDAEQVFILQAAGVKDYWLRANTVAARPALHEIPDPGLVALEVSPETQHRLAPGDWLHVPSPFWHVAESVERSLSISVGVFP